MTERETRERLAKTLWECKDAGLTLTQTQKLADVLIEAGVRFEEQPREIDCAACGGSRREVSRFGDEGPCAVCSEPAPEPDGASVEVRIAVDAMCSNCLHWYAGSCCLGAGVTNAIDWCELFTTCLYSDNLEATEQQPPAEVAGEVEDKPATPPRTYNPACRSALIVAGKPYPRSGCSVHGSLFGGEGCPLLPQDKCSHPDWQRDKQSTCRLCGHKKETRSEDA